MLDLTTKTVFHFKIVHKYGHLLLALDAIFVVIVG